MPADLTYAVPRLTAGQSFGNLDAFARTSRESDLQGLYSAGLDAWMVGELRIQPEVLQGDGGWAAVVPLSTSFSAADQVTRYQWGPVEVEKAFLVPSGEGLPERCCAWLVRVRNGGQAPVRVALAIDLRWNATPIAAHSKQPPGAEAEKVVESQLDGPLLVAATERRTYTANPAGFLPPGELAHGDPGEVRVFGSRVEPDAVEFLPASRVRLRYERAIAPGEQWSCPFKLAYSGEGVEAAVRAFAQAGDPSSLLVETGLALDRSLAPATVVTPSAAINAVVRWAKVNTLRVQQRFAGGLGFTNDPPQDVVVVRDAAWYALGASWLSPAFVAGMWQLLRDHGIHEGGKLTEFLTAARLAEGRVRREDYGLDLNDDTPLFVVATVHHAAVTGDLAFLREAWPAVRGAVSWLLSRKGRHGLLWCTVRGTNTYGIASWRNIVPGYQLTGAVTEINAEAVGALRSGAAAARALGHLEDANRWEAEAGALAKAIEAHLVNPASGLYRLALEEGPDGQDVPRDDVTGDQVFPLLFGAATAARASQVAARLIAPSSWTRAGVRTVPRDEPAYDPTHGWGLLGGIWPNLTAWVAHAVRHEQPGRVAEALEGLWQLVAPGDPSAAGRVVPGEFPEWLDGDSGESRGMAMSPWMPPTALWLALEGLAGLSPTPGGPVTVAPSLPEGWRWVAARQLPGPQGPWAFCWIDGTLHVAGAREVAAAGPIVRHGEDLTDRLEANAPLALAFGEPGGRVTVFVGAPHGEHGKQPGTFRARIGQQEWTGTLAPGEARVIELVPASHTSR